MNGAHIHLLVNHISLFALVIGFAALLASMIRNSKDLRVFAVVLFVLAGIFGWVAVESGEKAADVLKSLGGDSDKFIDQHAQAAVWALRSCLTVAVLAIATEIAARKQSKAFKPLQWVLLLLALHGCTVFATTAYLGGLIRHTEVRN